MPEAHRFDPKSPKAQAYTYASQPALALRSHETFGGVPVIVTAATPHSCYVIAWVNAWHAACHDFVSRFSASPGCVACVFLWFCMVWGMRWAGQASRGQDQIRIPVVEKICFIFYRKNKLEYTRPWPDTTRWLDRIGLDPVDNRSDHVRIGLNKV